MSPDPHSMSRLGLSLWALSRPYCISPQYAPPRLTNKKYLGTPMGGQQCCASVCTGLNIQQCWELLANHVASVFTGLSGVNSRAGSQKQILNLPLDHFFLVISLVYFFATKVVAPLQLQERSPTFVKVGDLV